MARAYSLDLRERVVAAVEAGQSCRAVAARHYQGQELPGQHQNKRDFAVRICAYPTAAIVTAPPATTPAYGRRTPRSRGS